MTASSSASGVNQAPSLAPAAQPPMPLPIPSPEKLFTAKQFNDYIGQQRKLVANLYLQEEEVRIQSFCDNQGITKLKAILDKKTQQAFLDAQVRTGFFIFYHPKIFKTCEQLIQRELPCYQFFDGALAWGYTVEQYLLKVLPDYKEWPAVFVELYATCLPKHNVARRLLAFPNVITESLIGEHHQTIQENSLLPLIKRLENNHHPDAPTLQLLLQTHRLFFHLPPEAESLQFQNEKEYQLFYNFQKFLDKLLNTKNDLVENVHLMDCFPSELSGLSSIGERVSPHSIAMRIGLMETSLLTQLLFQPTCSFNTFINDSKSDTLLDNQHNTMMAAIPKHIKKEMTQRAFVSLGIFSIAWGFSKTFIELVSKGRSDQIYHALSEQASLFRLWHDLSLFTKISLEEHEQLVKIAADFATKSAYPQLFDPPSEGIVIMLLLSIKNALREWQFSCIKFLHQFAKTKKPVDVSGFSTLFLGSRIGVLSIDILPKLFDEAKQKVLDGVNIWLSELPATMIQKEWECIADVVIEVFGIAAAPLTDYIRLVFTCEFFRTGDTKYILSHDSILNEKSDQVQLILDFLLLKDLEKLTSKHIERIAVTTPIQLAIKEDGSTAPFPTSSPDATLVLENYGLEKRVSRAKATAEVVRLQSKKIAELIDFRVQYWQGVLAISQAFQKQRASTVVLMNPETSAPPIISDPKTARVAPLLIRKMVLKYPRLLPTLQTASPSFQYSMIQPAASGPSPKATPPHPLKKKKKKKGGQGSSVITSTGAPSPAVAIIQSAPPAQHKSEPTASAGTKSPATAAASSAPAQHKSEPTASAGTKSPATAVASSAPAQHKSEPTATTASAGAPSAAVPIPSSASGVSGEAVATKALLGPTPKGTIPINRGVLSTSNPVPDQPRPETASRSEATRSRHVALNLLKRAGYFEVRANSHIIMKNAEGNMVLVSHSSKRGSLKGGLRVAEAINAATSSTAPVKK